MLRELLRKKLKIVIYDGDTLKYRPTAVVYEFRFQWTADRKWNELEHMRKVLGFNRWWHMIVDIGFRVDD